MKIQIDIRDYISPELAVEAVRQVIAHGKVSRGEKGKMYYCWATTFGYMDEEIVVYTRQYRKNDCFMVYKNRKR